MPRFSRRSRDNLETCHLDLQTICNQAIKKFDFSVICGHRNMVMQDLAFEDGYSNAKWPFSMHNRDPSLAVDLAPYPIDYQDIEGFKDLALIIFSVALEHNIRLRWGGHFKKLDDYGHFELII